MFAVGGVHTSFSLSYQQFVLRQQIKKSIPADVDLLLLEKWLQHHKQFTAAASWLLLTYVQHLLNNACCCTNNFKLVLLLFVKSLP